MRVLVIASFADSIIGFRGDLLKAMKDQGKDVHVAAPDYTEEQKHALQDLGVTPHSFALQRTGLNPVKDTKSLISLYQLIKQVKPEQTLAYTIKPVIYGAIAARLAGVKNVYSMITGLGYVFTQQLTAKQKLLHQIVCVLYKVGLGFSKGVFFQNPDDAELFISKSLVAKSKATLINGSGINLQRFPELALPEMASNKPDLHFLLIARLLKDKGVLEYAEAAKQLKAQGYSCVFHLAGWIDDNPSAISQQDLDSWIDQELIEYHGRVSDVIGLIQQCHVYVLPSYREGTPRTVLEAMSCARAIVTTDAPGCRETVVNNQNGYLIKPKSADSLTTALKRYLEQPELVKQHGLASRQYAEQRYDVNRVNQRILNVMNGVD
ncbi:glycosyltransferase family 4 protein [Agarivorans sp. DSG3-1]|uniref:glycosyltransferase family 4 protein n=1 Tax=Agarivorans sp. DSG3-1 TaxID=3342249 RepID=UPI00398E868A